MSGGQKEDEEGAVRKALKKKREIFDCVLLPAPSRLKRKRSNTKSHGNGQTKYLEPRSIFVDDDPSTKPGPSTMAGLGDGGEESDDVVLVSGEVCEDDDLYGFQMLDPMDCIMLPWTNVSTSQRSLYVPPALGNLLHHMGHSLEMERKARIRGEERFLRELVKRNQVETEYKQLIERLNLDIHLLRQGRKVVAEEATALSAVGQMTEITPCKSSKGASVFSRSLSLSTVPSTGISANKTIEGLVTVAQKPKVLLTKTARFDKAANESNIA